MKYSSVYYELQYIKFSRYSMFFVQFLLFGFLVFSYLFDQPGVAQIGIFSFLISIGITLVLLDVTYFLINTFLIIGILIAKSVPLGEFTVPKHLLVISGFILNGYYLSVYQKSLKF